MRNSSRVNEGQTKPKCSFESLHSLKIKQKQARKEKKRGGRGKRKKKKKEWPSSFHGSRVTNSLLELFIATTCMWLTHSHNDPAPVIPYTDKTKA